MIPCELGNEFLAKCYDVFLLLGGCWKWEFSCHEETW